MASDSLPEFEVIQLSSLLSSKAVDHSTIVQSYRAFRLLSLQTDPDAFASTYMEESREKDEFWQARLANAKASYFIAVSLNSDPSSSSNWLGMLTLLGPQDDEGLHTVSTNPWVSQGKTAAGMAARQIDNKVQTQHERTVSFHFVGTYTVASARRRGIGNALFHAALSHAEKIGRQSAGASLQCTIFVDADNSPALRLYENSGFEGVESHTYKPKPVESGERAERLALKMVLRKSLRDA